MSGIIGPKYIIEYREIINKAVELGYSIPTIDQQYKQNLLIYNLKTNNLWNKKSALWVFATNGGSDFATINWINPSLYRCTKVGGLTFTSNIGFTGNGSNAYLNTNHKPIIDGGGLYVQNSANCIYFSTSPLVQTLAGVSETGGLGFSLLPQHYSQAMALRMNSTAQTVVSGLSDPTDGNFSSWDFDRASASTQTGRRNKTQIFSQSVSSTTLSTGDLYLLARNRVSSTDVYSTGTFNMFALGESLSNADRDLQHDIFQSYLTSI